MIEMLSGTGLAGPVREAIEKDQVSAYSTFHALAEAEYILCRNLGREIARAKIEGLIESGTVELVEARGLIHEVARIKCERALALPDAFTISLAEKMAGAAVFAKHEEELEKEARKKPFSTRLIFLEDLEKSVKALIGKKPYSRHVPIEELEEMSETR